MRVWIAQASHPGILLGNLPRPSFAKQLEDLSGLCFHIAHLAGAGRRAKTWPFAHETPDR